MMSLTLSLLLQIAAANPGSHDYTTAYKQTMETGQPLVVLVGADWCPGCQQMKQTAIPEVKRNGGLEKVAYSYVNYDQQGKLAQQLMQGSSIPQLILFHKTAEGWQRQQLTGAHSAVAIKEFIDRATDSPISQVSRRQ